jgi:hypothetical protein
MAQTIEQQRAEAERAAALAELKRQRAVKAAELQRIDDKLAQVRDHDFMSRLGALELKSMSVKQRSEVVARIGYEKFRDLLLSGR